MKEKEKEGQTE